MKCLGGIYAEHKFGLPVNKAGPCGLR